MAALAILLALPAGAAAKTITINASAADGVANDSQCSLREAVIAANQNDFTNPSDVDDCTGDVVPFGDDTIIVPGDVTLTVGGGTESAATHDLDISDLGSGSLTISSSVPGTRRTIDQTATCPASPADCRVIDAIDDSLTLESLKITGGDPGGVGGSGGGIQYVALSNAATLKLDDVEVSGNKAAVGTSNESGGGVQVREATVEVVDSDITGNEAGGAAAGIDGEGGGIAVEGQDPSLTVTDSVVSDNKAGAAAGAGGSGLGGGIYFNASAGGTSALNLSGTTVDGNRAGGLGSAGSSNRGGGIFVGQFGIDVDTNVTGGSISGNRAGGGSGNGEGLGGAINQEADAGSMAIAGVELTDNRAGGDDGVAEPTTSAALGAGGAILTRAPISISDSTFTGNLAGALPNDTAPLVDISGIGGAIQYDPNPGNPPATEDMTVTNSSFVGNVAGNGTGAGGSGGGAIATANPGELTVSDSRFATNVSRNAGGAINRFLNDDATPSSPDRVTDSSFSGNLAGSSGGAIDLVTRDSFRIDSSTFSANQVSGAGSMTGGAISASSDSAAERGELRLVNSTVSGNSTGSGPVQGFRPDGGGIFAGATNPIDLDLAYSTIAGNSAIVGTVPFSSLGGNLRVVGNPGNKPTVAIEATVVADGTGNGANCSIHNAATEVNLTSEGGNVEGLDSSNNATNECGFDHATDNIGDEARLASLADNGGPDAGDAGSTAPILTRALLAGSPAIDRIATVGGDCPIAFDQRNVSRPRGARCDSGAYERVPPVVRRPIPPAVFCAGQRATIVGTGGPNVLRGTPGRDVIHGLGGRDRVVGLGSRDVLCGGASKDKIKGGGGNDKLFGGGGRDVLKGGPGRDKLRGGPGKDKQRQ